MIGAALTAFLLLVAEDPTLKVAKEHFGAGKQAYEAGEYEKAIREFKAARQVKPSPILEYNIALAYERLGRLDLAVTHYEAYLIQDPAAQNRADVESKIRNLQNRITRQGAYAATEASGAPAPPPAPAPPAGAPPSRADAGLAPLPPPPASATRTAPVSLSPAPPAAAGTPRPPGESLPAGPAAATGAAPPRERRFALGVRMGGAGMGDLGAQAFGGQVHTNVTGLGIGLFAAFRLPVPRLHGEVYYATRSVDLAAPHKGRYSISSLGARAHYLVRPLALPLDIGGGLGFDFNTTTVDLTASGPAPGAPGRTIMTSKTSFDVALGLRVEASARYVIRDRHEIIVIPLALHFIPATSPSSMKTLPDDRSMPAATILDLDKGGTLYSFEVGYAFRL